MVTLKFISPIIVLSQSSNGFVDWLIFIILILAVAICLVQWIYKHFSQIKRIFWLVFCLIFFGFMGYGIINLSNKNNDLVGFLAIPIGGIYLVIKNTVTKKNRIS